MKSVRSVPSRRPSGSARSRDAVLVLGLALLLAVPICLEAQLFAPEPTEPRIPPLESSDASLNILKTLAHHPELVEAWSPFAGYVLRGSTLPPRDRELLILRTAYLRKADYEWGHHSRLAGQVGVSDEEIARVMEGPETAGWSSFDRALLRAADQLHKNAYIDERTWAYLDARYDTKQLMDVVFTVGQYNLVAMALKSFRVPMDEGVEGFPE